MIIRDLIKVEFRSRPNRFVVEFQSPELGVDLAHLHDPGRLTELLYPGAVLFIRRAANPNRKTHYDVIGCVKDGECVLINSAFHSDIAQELIESGQIKELVDYSIVRREFTYGDSRLDFLLNNNERDMLLEVKGCTLVIDNHAKFPDAPTIRGTRHLNELIHAHESDGYESTVLFLILKSDAEIFSPNNSTDPDFTAALKKAYDCGVNIVPYVFNIKRIENQLNITELYRIPLRFL